MKILIFKAIFYLHETQYIDTYNLSLISDVLLCDKFTEISRKHSQGNKFQCDEEFLIA